MLTTEQFKKLCYAHAEVSNTSGVYLVWSNIEKLVAAINAASGEQPADESDRLFVLLAEIRAACGDNGQREQDELVAYIAEQARDAERYRLLRRGQKWSVVDGIGDVLRADELDAAIDRAIAEKGERDE